MRNGLNSIYTTNHINRVGSNDNGKHYDTLNTSYCQRIGGIDPVSIFEHVICVMITLAVSPPLWIVYIHALNRPFVVVALGSYFLFSVDISSIVWFAHNYYNANQIIYRSARTIVGLFKSSKLYVSLTTIQELPLIWHSYKYICIWGCIKNTFFTLCDISDIFGAAQISHSVSMKKKHSTKLSELDVLNRLFMADVKILTKYEC